MRWKAAIFDMDGTLVDSMGMWRRVGMDYLASLGVCPQEDLGRVFEPLTFSQAARMMQQRYLPNSTEQEIIAGCMQLVADFYEKKAQCKPYALAFLQHLRRLGVPRCVATLTDPDLALPVLERLGLMGELDFCLTAQEVGKRKDEPDIYLQAAARMGVHPEETAVFEDSCFAGRTAKKAGFYLVGVDDPHEKERAQLQKLSDEYIFSFRQLL